MPAAGSCCSTWRSSGPRPPALQVPCPPALLRRGFQRILCDWVLSILPNARYGLRVRLYLCFHMLRSVSRFRGRIVDNDPLLFFLKPLPVPPTPTPLLFFIISPLRAPVFFPFRPPALSPSHRVFSLLNSSSWPCRARALPCSVASPGLGSDLLSRATAPETRRSQSEYRLPTVSSIHSVGSVSAPRWPANSESPQPVLPAPH